MSSFYGNYSVGEGGTGTSDYNQLLNKPFIQLVGTIQSPIVLNTLDFGNYLIKGSFIYTKLDTDMKEFKSKNYVEIFNDSVSQKKVAKYETFENSICYIYTIEFNNDDTCLRNKYSIVKSDGVLFIDESDLPKTGSEGVLYITERTIYQWRNNEYIDMNAPRWDTF